jgi:hypothetical protein
MLPKERQTDSYNQDAVIAVRQDDGKESFQHLNDKTTASLFLIPEAGSGLTGTGSRHPVNKREFEEQLPQKKKK